MPRLWDPPSKKESEGYAAAVELVYRLLGGGRPRLRSAQAEREEVDRYAAAKLVWNAVDGLHRLPERIAGQVAKLFSKDSG